MVRVKSVAGHGEWVEVAFAGARSGLPVQKRERRERVWRARAILGGDTDSVQYCTCSYCR